MKKKSDQLLIAIPYAGGSAYNMSGLADSLKDSIDVHTLELPGRGRRVNEPLLKSIDAVLEDLHNRVTPLLQQYRTYYVFGHSLGALLGYRLIKKLQQKHCALPAHFFVSGTGGPSVPPYDDCVHLLPSPQFRDMLRQLGGCPEEVLDNELLMDFFEPIIRSDFEMLETFQYENGGPMDIPVTGFFGTEEETDINDMQLWQKESTQPVRIIQLEGNHFFIFRQWETIAGIIKKTIGLL